MSGMEYGRCGWNIVSHISSFESEQRRATGRVALDNCLACVYAPAIDSSSVRPSVRPYTKLCYLSCFALIYFCGRPAIMLLLLLDFEFIFANLFSFDYMPRSLSGVHSPCFPFVVANLPGGKQCA
jgi:hypothetical protein